MFKNINDIIPVKSYLNVSELKIIIRKENNNKSGIYLWTNLVSGKSYIGSSINLSRRLNNYFSKGYLIRVSKKNKSKIYKALLKYDYVNFRLDILEYCSKKHVIEREQYYLDKLNPEYNICKVAGSSLGCTYSEDARTKLSVANKGLNNPMYGKHHTNETKLKIKTSLIKTFSVKGFIHSRPSLGKHHSEESRKKYQSL